jgi:hypothetical protein
MSQGAGSEWYVMKGGKKVGPLDGAKLKKMADSGQISPSDMVWKDGFPDWKPASTVKGLFAAQVKPAPAVPSAREAEDDDRRRPARRDDRDRDSYSPSTGGGAFEFHGTAGGFFVVLILLYLSNICFLILPWGICNAYTWYADNTTIDGRRLRFTGTGGGMFGLILKVVLLSMITCGIYYFWGIPEIIKWITEHMEFAD